MPEDKGDRKAANAVEEVSAEDAKRTLGELLSRAGFGGERIPITRHGKRIAALVSAKDLEALEGAA